MGGRKWRWVGELTGRRDKSTAAAESEGGCGGFDDALPGVLSCGETERDGDRTEAEREREGRQGIESRQQTAEACSRQQSRQSIRPG